MQRYFKRYSYKKEGVKTCRGKWFGFFKYNSSEHGGYDLINFDILRSVNASFLIDTNHINAREKIHILINSKLGMIGILLFYIPLRQPFQTYQMKATVDGVKKEKIKLDKGR